MLRHGQRIFALNNVATFYKPLRLFLLYVSFFKFYLFHLYNQLEMLKSSMRFHYFCAAHNYYPTEGGHEDERGGRWVWVQLLLRNVVDDWVLLLVIRSGLGTTQLFKYPRQRQST